MSELSRFDLGLASLDGGTVLLEASAGTGKTYTLVGLVLRLLLERKVAELPQILVVTFTVAATEELKTRLRRGLEQVLAACGGEAADAFYAALARLPDAAATARQALDDFDRAPILTIHGFCKRLLDEAAFESREPFEQEFLVDAEPLLERAAADALRELYEPEPSVRTVVLAGMKLTPEVLAGLHRLWRRHPDVQLAPWPPAPAVPLAALQAALADAAAHWSPAIAAAVAQLRFLSKKSPFGSDPVAGIARLGEQLGRQSPLAIDTLAALSPRMERLAKKARLPEGPFATACDRIAAQRDNAAEHLRIHLLQRLDARLATAKRQANALSFDDLLQRAAAALQDPARGPALREAVRSRYRTALVDEFQDTDALQYRIFADCFADRSLFLIGDPKQSIYGFRGADLDTYLQASQGASRRQTLAENHRSSAQLVAAVGHLFAAPHAFLHTGIRLPAVTAAAAPTALQLDGDPGPAFRWRLVAADLAQRSAETTALLARDVAAEAVRLLRAGVQRDGHPLQPRDLAVLTRSNAQALLVQQELRAAGIPAAIGRAGDVLETAEVEELERLLRAVLQPADLGRVRAAMATRLWGLDAAALVAQQADEAVLDGVLHRLEHWRRLWHRAGVVAMAEQAFADLHTVPRLLAERGGERTLTNLQQLVELLHHAEHGERLSPEGLLSWLAHERSHGGSIDPQLRELRLESDEDAAQIVTAHGSKGLQYEVVFCPFLWSGQAAKGAQLVATATGRRLAMEPSDEELAAAEADRLAEEIRLLYVAVTRAKRRCYVHVGNLGKGAYRGALAWLLQPAADPADLRDPDRKKDWQAAVEAAFADGLPDLLAAVCARSGGTMGIDLVSEVPRLEPLPPAPLPELRDARRPQRVPTARGLHSFTSLVAGAAALEALPDVADPAPTAAAEPTTAATPPVGMFAFARGARAGTGLHEVLEHTPLHQLDHPDVPARVQRLLAAHGLAEPGAHRAPIDPAAVVLQNLRDLAAAQLGPAGPTLADLGRDGRAVEWQFTLPAGGDLGRLAAAFAAHGSELARRYAPRLAQLPARRLHGFLTGFVDLVAVAGERHWILDWKSNHLGDTAADYGPAALAAAMLEGDYVLQYHLYVLALHRQLRVRLPGYDPDRHLGGSCYVFLRGVQAGRSDGLVVDRVPTPLLTAMDHWLGGGA